MQVVGLCEAWCVGPGGALGGRVQPPVQHSGLLCQWLGSVRDGSFDREGRKGLQEVDLPCCYCPKPPAAETQEADTVSRMLLWIKGNFCESLEAMFGSWTFGSLEHPRSDGHIACSCEARHLHCCAVPETWGIEVGILYGTHHTHKHEGQN